MSLFDNEKFDDIDINGLQLYKAPHGVYVLSLQGVEERGMEKSGAGTPLPESTVYDFKVVDAPDSKLVGRSAKHRSFQYSDMGFKIENIAIWSSLAPSEDHVAMSINFRKYGKKLMEANGGPLKDLKVRVRVGEKTVFSKKHDCDKTVSDLQWSAA